MIKIRTKLAKKKSLHRARDMGLDASKHQG